MITYEMNKSLFAAWCGLTVSGYDMAQPEEKVASLIKRIRKLLLSSECIQYFARTKTDEIEVNPYFPWASAMSAGCFYVETSMEKCVDFLRSTGTGRYDASFVQWFLQLPIMIKEVEQAEGFDVLWKEYEKIISQMRNQYQCALQDIQSKLYEYGLVEKEINLIFVPNLLQSPYLADYVMCENIIYVICNQCSLINITHEYLHIIISKMKKEIMDLIHNYGISCLVDPIKMKNMGYMLDDSKESQCHAVEDCIVRGVSALLSENEISEEYFQINEQSGFGFANHIWKYGQKRQWKSLSELIYNAAKEKL